MRYDIRVRLFGGAKYFGPGIAELFERIERTGSIRAAAGEMEMAYSKAWRLITTAEKETGKKLIDSHTGGKRGGGASLTEEGRSLLKRYRSFEAELRKKGDELFASYFD